MAPAASEKGRVKRLKETRKETRGLRGLRQACSFRYLGMADLKVLNPLSDKTGRGAGLQMGLKMALWTTQAELKGRG